MASRHALRTIRSLARPGVGCKPEEGQNDPAAATWANTRISQGLGIKYPIIQGPLGGFAAQRLAAAVWN